MRESEDRSVLASSSSFITFSVFRGKKKSKKFFRYKNEEIHQRRGEQQEEEGMNLQRGYKEQSFILLFFSGRSEARRQTSKMTVCEISFILREFLSSFFVFSHSVMLLFGQWELENKRTRERCTFFSYLLFLTFRKNYKKRRSEMRMRNRRKSLKKLSSQEYFN